MTLVQSAASRTLGSSGRDGEEGSTVMRTPPEKVTVPDFLATPIFSALISPRREEKATGLSEESEPVARSISARFSAPPEPSELARRMLSLSTSVWAAAL